MRGFNIDQFEKRTSKAQQLMQHHGLDALLLTTETNVRYFTGFLTRFWESPTRPWYLIIPSKGKPIAVIPSIGKALMSKTWVEDIRTWPSPDLKDDGISLLSDTLEEIAKNKNIGSKLINARSETLHERPSFKHLIKSNRCIVLSDGYYEWNTTNSKKQPYYFYDKQKNILQMMKFILKNFLKIQDILKFKYCLVKIEQYICMKEIVLFKEDIRN